MLHSHLSPMSSMQPVQQYLYESNGQHAPDYRASQQQQHTAMSHAPLLPPIQHFDGQNMQSQHSYPPASMNGAQMSPHPPPSFHPNQFQYPNGGMQPPPMPSNVGANGQMGVMRYPIPPQGPMPMSGSRGKASKDVKRRTKTGCLTCRKRRIKVSIYVFKVLRFLKVSREARRLRPRRTVPSEKPRKQARLCSR